MVENNSTKESQDDNDFEKVLKSNYWDEAVDKNEQRSSFKPIIRKKTFKSPPASRRTDRYQTDIEWGQKSHKVTYVDQVEQKPLV